MTRIMKDITQRIVDRFPWFYGANEYDSNIYKFCNSFTNQLEITKKDLIDIMLSHWIETASGIDIDLFGRMFKLSRLDNESDLHFKNRLLFFIEFYFKTSLIFGGGTKNSIMAQLILFLEVTKNDEMTINSRDITINSIKKILSSNNFEIIENPEKNMCRYLEISNGIVWEMDNNSIFDENFLITLTVTDENSSVSYPEFRIESFGLIIYEGILKYGQNLIIQNDGNALLDGVDVTSSVKITKDLKFLRKKTRWYYKDATSPNIGRFDRARFNISLFQIHIPKILFQIRWKSHLRSTFELRISKNVSSKFSQKHIQDIVNSIKAVGVNALITIKEADINNTGVK